MNIDELQAVPELDALIAERVMGWKRASYPDSHFEQEGCSNMVEAWVRAPALSLSPGSINVAAVRVSDWSPSTNIAHAWEVVEKIRPLAPPGCAIAIHDAGHRWLVAFEEESGAGWYASGNTAALAICRAALKAVGA